MSELRKVIKLRVKSLNDLARMAASVIAIGQPTYIIRIKDGGKVIYGLLAVFRDYFNLHGIPLLYYYIDEHGGIEGNYMLIRSDETGEKVEVSKGIKPTYISIPIVDLAEFPEFLI
ncbi:MAG: cren protein [Sulfolobales archaeon]|nr:cren protein [Sulfolobales archaeon]MCX8185655.1 cren protein [Sulfolobales archaeon]MDW7969598.1 cren protein [Sulfolobales archaeon]